MKLEDIIIKCSRALLLLASLFSFIYWGLLTLMMFSYSGGPRNAEEVLLTFFPLVYFSLTIYGCLMVRAKRKLIALGISLNLPLAGLLLYLFIRVEGMEPALRIGLAYIAVWALLCLGYAWFRPSAT